MANSIVPVSFEFLSNTIRVDGLVNITALATAYRLGYQASIVGRKPTSSLTRDWIATKEATESIAYLERVSGIPQAELVVVENGVGTWVHPDLAEIFAQWISVEYRFAVVQLIRLAKESKQDVKPPQRQLTPVSIHEYMLEARAWGLDSDPLIKSLLTQRLAEELGSKALPSATIQTQVILTVRAAELGHSQAQIGNGTQLGKFVSRLIQPNGKTQHGKYPVNVYDLTPELDEAIAAFFR
jgi:desulfoferrodoxin (superoxide reductase-like protein)